MTTILDTIRFSPYERQAYTKFEISEMVKQKRKKLGLNVDQLAFEFDIKPNLILDIEEARRSFNAEMYKACSRILEMPLNELLKKDVEAPLSVKFRKSEYDVNQKAVNDTVELANTLFHEMVIQHKMNIK